MSTALEQVRATGYGIVMPTPDEMRLEVPQIVRRGSNYGVRLKASAPSIHMMRADIETEISPMVGDEKQKAKVEEIARIILDQAKIAEGEAVSDPSFFAEKLSEYMAASF